MMLKIVVELVACWPGRFQRLWNGHLWMAARRGTTGVSKIQRELCLISNYFSL